MKKVTVNSNGTHDWSEIPRTLNAFYWLYPSRDGWVTAQITPFFDSPSLLNKETESVDDALGFKRPPNSIDNHFTIKDMFK